MTHTHSVLQKLAKVEERVSDLGNGYHLDFKVNPCVPFTFSLLTLQSHGIINGRTRNRKHNERAE